MRMSYDPVADAAYLRLAEPDQGAGAVSTSTCAPPGDLSEYQAIDPIALDWSDGRLVGIEILFASRLLPQEVLDGAVGHSCQ